MTIDSCLNFFMHHTVFH